MVAMQTNIVKLCVSFYNVKYLEKQLHVLESVDSFSTLSRNIGPLCVFFFIWLYFWQCFFFSFQDFPIIFASSSTVLLHATFGLPRPRLPCGSRWAVYDVYGPAIPTSDTEFPTVLIWLVLVHRSLFDIWIGQNMHKILRRHSLIKTCNSSVKVLLAFRVSQQYKRTDFVLELNRRSFVFRSSGVRPRVPDLM
jgi:hypothetical protein